MSEIAAAYIILSIGSSLAIYFRFIDKKLDKLLDKIFAGWHEEEEDLELLSGEN